MFGKANWDGASRVIAVAFWRGRRSDYVFFFVHSCPVLRLDFDCTNRGCKYALAKPICPALIASPEMAIGRVYRGPVIGVNTNTSSSITH
jgi:hypothetical protein